MEYTAQNCSYEIMDKVTPFSDSVNIIRQDVTYNKSKIEHLRDLLHSDDKGGPTCQENLNFSKYNVLGPPGPTLKYEALKTQESYDTEETRTDEHLLPLEHFILAMPPGTVFGAHGDSRKLSGFSQRIQDWNVCHCNGSKLEDILKKMAVENISPFSVYLKLFLKTTHYFIALSRVGVHIYNIGEPTTQTVDKVAELEDIIVAKLNGSREDQLELRHIITEILFDNATQNIQHPGIEVGRCKEGEFLLVTLGLKMPKEQNCGEPIAVHSSELKEEKQSEIVAVPSMAESVCSLQENEAGQGKDVFRPGADINLRSSQQVNSEAPQLIQEEEPAGQVDESTVKWAEKSCVTCPEQNLLISKPRPERVCTPEQSDTRQTPKLVEEILHYAVQEPVETGQQEKVSKRENGSTQDSNNNNRANEYDGVELCMTVDAASDEECDSADSSSERDVDVSVLCDVEMYSTASPGHSLWSDTEANEPVNMSSSKLNGLNSSTGNKATVLSENTNLSDTDLNFTIQSRFKNIRVYQNKNLKTKAKDNRNKYNKENSENVGLSEKPESESSVLRKNNIDAANASCDSQGLKHTNHIPCYQTKMEEQRFMDKVRKKKLKLMEVDPTVDLNSDNVYVMFNKRLVTTSLGGNDLLCKTVYCCGLCREKFGSYKDLILHTKSHNTSKIINVTVYTPKMKINKGKILQIKCKECGYVCAEDGSCTREDEFLCEICGKRFHSRKRLSCHLKSRHLPRTPKKPALCHTCGTKFSTMSALRRHNDLRHTGAPLITCDYCGKKFKTKSQIARHIRIHLGLKPFECIACGMRFGVRMRWREHMYLHTGLKPYNCDICTQDFRHMSALSLHKKMHRLGKI